LRNYPFEKNLIRFSKTTLNQKIPQLLIMIADFEQSFDTAAFSPAPDPLGRSPAAAEQADGPHHYRLSGSGFTGHHHQRITLCTVKLQVQGINQGQIFYFKFEQH
jgi:hypothetical protein